MFSDVALSPPQVIAPLLTLIIFYGFYKFSDPSGEKKLHLVNDTGPFDFLQAKAVQNFRRHARKLVLSGFENVRREKQSG
jgi:hypothetical protein